MHNWSTNGPASCLLHLVRTHFYQSTSLIAAGDWNLSSGTQPVCEGMFWNRQSTKQIRINYEICPISDSCSASLIYRSNIILFSAFLPHLDFRRITFINDVPGFTKTKVDYFQSILAAKGSPVIWSLDSFFWKVAEVSWRFCGSYVYYCSMMRVISYGKTEKLFGDRTEKSYDEKNGRTENYFIESKRLW